MTRRWTTLLFLFLAAAAWADKPFLWKVEAGGQKPSYLFGSIHIPSPSVTNLAPSVERAFQASDAVYCELAFEEATVLKIAQASMGAKTPLSQALPPELYARTETELQRVVPGFKLAALERAEVWTVGFALAMLEYQVRYPHVTPLDLLLFQRAQAAGKATGGLETAEEQLGAMNSFTAAEQVDMLRASLDDMEAMRRQGQSPVERLLTAYRSGSAEAVDREVSRSLERCSPALKSRFEQSLLHTRNRRMANRIAEKVRGAPDKSFLFVVGAMHGLGQDSVVDMLWKAGLKVERVSH
jgi:uncharacterized protein YbaP (TraB family)